MGSNKIETEKPNLVQVTSGNKPMTERPTLVEILRNSPLTGLDVDFSRKDDEVRDFVFDETEKNDYLRNRSRDRSCFAECRGRPVVW